MSKEDFRIKNEELFPLNGFVVYLFVYNVNTTMSIGMPLDGRLR